MKRCSAVRVDLMLEAMTGDRRLYNKLRYFRTGIEATIPYLQRCFAGTLGLERARSLRGGVRSAIFTDVLLC